MIDIRLGDCLEMMATLDAGSVDAIVTDPPYGTNVPSGGDGYGRRQNYGGTGRTITNDSDLSALDGMLEIAPRVLAKHSWLAIFCSPKRHAEVAALIESRGFPVAGEVVWDKARPGLGGGIRYQHETVLLCQHGKPTGHGSLFSVIRSHVSPVDKHRRHPHEKPLDVMRDLVTYCSDPGALILDPFAGSGSTLVACMKTGRRGLGIEVDPQYIPMIEARCRKAETPLFAALTES